MAKALEFYSRPYEVIARLARERQGMPKWATTKQGFFYQLFLEERQMAEFPGERTLVIQEPRWKMLQRALNKHFQVLADEWNKAIAVSDLAKLMKVNAELQELFTVMEELEMLDL